MPSVYLTNFFAEKDISSQSYDVLSPSGVPHYLSTEVVLEHLSLIKGDELKGVEAIIRKIDFYNGDLHHFFDHLATGLAAQFESQ